MCKQIYTIIMSYLILDHCVFPTVFTVILVYTDTPVLKNRERLLNFHQITEKVKLCKNFENYAEFRWYFSKFIS